MPKNYKTHVTVIMNKQNSGFTLLEILMTLMISGVAMTGIYQTYYSQQRSYIIQQSVANMQQNLRVAMFMMVGEIRMAGYDPTGKAGAGIAAATPASSSVPADDAMIRFTRDLNGDGDIDDSSEDITYSLYSSNGIKKLGRRNPSLNRPVVSYIDALDLIFLNKDNNETDVLSDIRSVQITVVARTERAEKDYMNDVVYRNRKNTIIFGPASDGFRRSMLSTQVKCRNLGF